MTADVMIREASARKVPQRRDYITLERYYEIAADSHTRVEYLDGKVFFMDGVSHNHGAIQMLVGGFLFFQLAPAEYTLLSSNVSIRARRSGYFFPDLTVVRGEPSYSPRNDLLNPVMVVEVLSKSTRSRDLNTKLPVYRAMSSLEHILVIEQSRRSVAHHIRVGDGWTRQEYAAPGDVVPLDSLGASLTLAQIYRGIAFSTDSSSQ